MQNSTSTATACTSCPASSTPRCTSASPGSSTRRTSPPAPPPRRSAASPPSSRCRTPSRRRCGAAISPTSAAARRVAPGWTWPSLSARRRTTSSELAELERLPGCAGDQDVHGQLDRHPAGRRRRRPSPRCWPTAAAGSPSTPRTRQRLRERFTIVRGGADPARHPEWRDAETAVRRDPAAAGAGRGHAKRRVHVLHVSTAEEMEMLRDHRDLATVEVTPQHLTLAAPDCYEELDSFAQMNPPIRDARIATRCGGRCSDGLVDCIGSDHAPHTREEKKQALPGEPVRHARRADAGAGDARPRRQGTAEPGAVRRPDQRRSGARSSASPGAAASRLGYAADFTVVDLKARRMITNRWIASRCGWTPFDGMTVCGWPIATVVRGKVVMRDGSLIGHPKGKLVRFLECL